MTTIGNSTTAGIDLNNGSYTSPVVVNPGVSISGYYQGYAVYAGSGSWTITNSGGLAAVGGGGGGIHLGGGGVITNLPGGEIGSAAPNSTGIYILGGTGAVTNAGSIASVWLQGGGAVDNQAGATITGGNASGGYGVGMHLTGTVTNAGAITGTGLGVEVDDGGGVTNLSSGVIIGTQAVGVLLGFPPAPVGGGYLTNQAGGMVEGGNGVLGGSETATVSNAGTIEGTTAGTVSKNGITLTLGSGVTLSTGGTVTNEAGGVISGVVYGIAIAGGGTVVNEGGIAATGTSDPGFRTGVYLRGGGAVTNTASASITGFEGVEIVGAGTVANDGSIVGSGPGPVGPSSVGVVITGDGVLINGASALLAGYDAVDLGDGGTLANYGTVKGQVFLAGGTVTNGAAGLITGPVGININGSAGTVLNDGTIAATATLTGGGVDLVDGGSVTNRVSGAISSAANGVTVNLDAGTVVNDGDITASAAGVGLDLGGSVTNGVSGTITGGIYGVGVYAGGTLTNAGTIIGTQGTAVVFAGTVASRLVLEPGFAFSGLVDGSASASNALELTSAASPGTVTGLGTEFLNFGPVDFDAGARWFVAGDTVGLGGTISGFAPGNTIELTGVTAAGWNYAGGVLTIEEAGGAATLELPGPFGTASFTVTNVAAGADVTVACFAAGTRILTAGGAVAVVALRAGDRVATMGGRLARVVWAGQKRAAVPPVRVRAGAFGAGLPTRDLRLSPDHAVFVDGVLVPVHNLINGSTVTHEQVDEITYYHVELERHDVVLAEGLPSESYLDTGNRSAFASSSPAQVRCPNFARGGSVAD